MSQSPVEEVILLALVVATFELDLVVLPLPGEAAVVRIAVLIVNAASELRHVVGSSRDDRAIGGDKRCADLT